MWQYKTFIGYNYYVMYGTINYLVQSHVNIAASVTMKYSLSYPSLIAPVPVDGAVHVTVTEFLLPPLL